MSKSVLIALMVSVLALPAQALPGETADKNGRDVYIVRMAAPPVARVLGRGGERRLDAGSPASRQVAGRLLKEQAETLAAARGRIGRDVQALHQYVHAFNGMALELTREEADRISKMPGVAQVQRRRRIRPLSDAGPAWAGAPGIWNGTQTGGLPGTKGEGVVIGVIDSGINMDHPSFADVGGDGYDHTNPRGAGNYAGWCNPSNPKYSPSYPCNDKLIGVWSYDIWDTDPEDDQGHGTQVASIAAGNQLTVPLTGSLQRVISGVAPHANLISYDVCESYSYCYDSWAIAAIDQAVADGVDVLTLAFGNDYYYDGPWQDPMALALLGAREAGVFAAVPAGNEGYYSDSVTSTASSPWLLAVGTSTHNRRFSSSVTSLSGGNTTPPPTLPAVALTDAYGPAPIVDAATYGNESCYYPFAGGTLTGKIVVCAISPYSDGWNEVANAKLGGAGGVILVDDYDYYDTVLEPIAYQSPVARLYEDQGYQLRSWLSTGSGHTGRISATVLDTGAANGDIVPDFSSRGPGFLWSLLKPDVLAPGVDILAASSDPRDYAVHSGTSLSSAFAAGSAALLIALHPAWTPAEVQSALLTTAKWAGLKEQDGTPTAAPFVIGSGRIDLSTAGRAGLVLDETGAHFEAADPELGGVPSSLNLASLAADLCTLSCSWTRTVRSALSTTSTWTVAVSVPGVTVGVYPGSFTLAPGATQVIQITMSGPPPSFGWLYGSLAFSENAGQAPPARFPVATRWVAQRKLTVVKSGAGSGTVTSSPAGIDCGPTCIAPFPDGTSATLTGTPAPGSAFVGWGGGYCYYGNGPCEISFYSDRQITAYFDIQPPDRALSNRVGVKDGMNPPVPEGTWRYYYFDVPAGTAEAVVDVFDLDSDVTLFVRQGDKPTPGSYTCYDSDYYGLSNRRCAISNPAAGRWWIGLLNEDTGPIQYSVRASWGSGADQALANAVPLDDYVSSAAAGAGWKYYYMDLVGESSELVVDLKSLSADADLFVRRGAKPDRSNYDCISSAVGTAAERCTLARPEPGRWWIAVNNFSAGTVTYTALASWTSTSGADFYTLPPCRLVDTRTSYPLQSGQTRSFLAAGHCGIPVTAKALMLNVTAIGATGSGYMTLYPDNLSVPLATTINFPVSLTRANSTVIRLGTDGEGRVGVYPSVTGGGVVHLLLDVAGYFE